MCLPWQVGCKVEEGAKSALNDAIDNLAKAVVEAFEHAVASLGTVWVYIGTPNLTGTGGGSAIPAGEHPEVAGSNIETVLAYVTWVGFGVAVLALLALGAYMSAMMKRGTGAVVLGRIGITLAAVMLISGASSLVAGFMPTGPQGAGGAVLFLQSSLWWFMGAAAVLSVIVAGIRMAWTQRAEPGKDLVQSVLTLIVVAGASTTVIGLLVTVADSAAVWILNGSLDCNIAEGGSCFAGNITALLALTTNPAAPALGPLLVIILGLLAILTSIIQIVLMVARGGMLVILAGILPLSASFTNTEMGKAWFKRAIGWLVAFILYKPAAAIVYAAAFQLAGTNVFQDDGSGMIAVLTGLVLMVLALFALPALMRFVTPMVAQTSGGGGGGMAAAAAVAAVPMGAAATGRLMGMSGGGGSDSGAPSSSSSSAPSGSSGTGPSGPSGDSSAGGQGPGGSSDSSSGADGSSGPGGATGSSGGAGETGTGTPGAEGAAGSVPGTGAGVGAGAGAGTGVAGGAGAGAGAGAASGAGAGAAGGGAAAAGAAGGPVGAAAGAALDAGTKAGQAAAGAAKSVGEEATGEEGGGPSGSR
ncbi:hypothetical protein [Brachybacterium sp. UNK5269]|uniref:hypothetical protein n=1 Tax=Brachybacterium sp. UNK5269 TaxID=3408576 RepID=UPI003BAE6895